MIRQILSLPSTNARNRRKRPSSQPSMQRMKKPCLAKEVTEVRAVGVEPF
jgi:hypothetical protein